MPSYLVVVYGSGPAGEQAVLVTGAYCDVMLLCSNRPSFVQFVMSPAAT